MMYRPFRTDLPPLLLTIPAKYSFHGSTSVTPPTSRESVRIIFAVFLEVIVTCHSVAIPVRHLIHVEHCAIQVYGTARANEDRRRLKVAKKTLTCGGMTLQLGCAMSFASGINHGVAGRVLVGDSSQWFNEILKS